MKIILILLTQTNILFKENDSIQKITSNDYFISNKSNNVVTPNFLNDSKNLVKFSFPIFNQPAISLQFERNVYKKISAGLSVGYVSEQEFLILKLITERKVSNEFAKNQISNIKTKIFSITPEMKIYFGKDAFKGFYLSPFIRYARYDVKFPLQYIEDTMSSYYQEVTFSGKFNSFTYGLSVGAQWNVYKNFYVDWLIVGPHLGNSTEKLILTTDLSQRQQKGITKSLDIIQKTLNKTDEIPTINFDYKVNEQGGTVLIKNPWAGMRFQLGVGYRF